MTIIDRFVGYLSSNSRGKLSRATREWRELTDDQRAWLGPELVSRGYEIPGTVTNEKPPIKYEYTEDDWELLAQKFWAIRKNDPTLSFCEIVHKAQDSLPQEKRRQVIRPTAYGRLIELIKERESAKPIQPIQPVAPPPPELTREEVLGTLTDSEVRDLLNRVLALTDLGDLLAHYPSSMVLDSIPMPAIIAHFTMRMLDNWNDSQTKTLLTGKAIADGLKTLADRSKVPGAAAVATQSLPKIMVIGLLGDQQNHVYHAVKNRCSIKFADKNQAAGVSVGHQDVVILMADFISHAMQAQVKAKISNGTQLVMHHGGIAKLIERINGIVG